MFTDGGLGEAEVFGEVNDPVFTGFEVFEDFEAGLVAEGVEEAG